MAKKPMTSYPRKWKEDNARVNAKEAVRLSRRDYGCTPQALENVVEANRLVAQARIHISTIGPHSSKRTMRLWQTVSRAERAVDVAENRLKKCLVKR